MALFRRKKQDSVLPEEVNEYYESQRRERTGVAIILGIAALVVTLLIGLALFFGGRWVYNQLTGDDEETTSQTEDANEGSVGEDGLSIDGGSSSSSTDASDGSTSDDSSTSSDGSTSGSASTDDVFSDIDLDGGEGSGASSQPSTGDSPQTVPATGDQPVLPATGDPGR